MAMTPGQTAKQWAAENPEAEGILTVRSITPAGRGGWKTKTKRTRFYVQAGEARMASRRKNRDPEWDDGPTYEMNGRCYRCAGLFLDCVLRLCYVRNPEAGQPATSTHIRGAVQYHHACAYLCPHCITPDDLSPAEFHRRGFEAEVQNDLHLRLEWLHWPEEGVPELGTIGAYWTATDGRGHSGAHPRPSNQEVTA